MANYSELKLTHRLFMQNYPFSRYAVADNPCTKLAKPLGECRFALVTTAGLRLKNDVPFDHSIKLGDTSFREISNNVEVQSLIEDHKSSSFDHAGIQSDKNLAFPLERFRELEKKGTIGSLNSRHFSFMGSIINPRNLVKQTAVEVAEKLKTDGVDAVFLTPV
jgi:D-proline reductase (dithiol) PrdB